MKAVMMSIRPEWCEKIISGEKTFEIRKSRPKLKAPFKCYIYCTYGMGLIARYDEIYPNHLIGEKVTPKSIYGNCVNGKVIGEFICDAFVVDKTFGHDPLLYKAACMTPADIAAYCTGEKMYGWHISELQIYDTPLELRDFKVQQSNEIWSFTKRLERPFQSWGYVYEADT